MNSETIGTIFDIKHFAVHDGPGIRTTVFFKGCPLNCLWCHNPEGINREPELFFYSRKCSVECNICVKNCPNNAIEKMNGIIHVDGEKCKLCGICQDLCVFDAIKIIGRKLPVNELIEEIENDRIFYEQSDGGVTLSGGEPLMQMDFLDELVGLLKERKIHITLDTSGYSEKNNILHIAEKVDIILYDIKNINEEDHTIYNGESNKVIIDNLKALSLCRADVIIRLPLLGGINDKDESIGEIAELINSLNNVRRVDLLPYHRAGNEKLERMDKKKEIPDFKPPTPERIKEISLILQNHGIKVKVGG